eukprot:2601222-Amphidinium_carterae.1
MELNAFDQTKGSKGKGKGRDKPNKDVVCHVCGKKGHRAKDCWQRPDGPKGVSQQGNAKGKGKGKDKGKGGSEKPKGKCWKCGKAGHYAKDCRSGLRALGEEGGSAPDPAGAASSSQNPVGGLFLAALTLSALGPQQQSRGHGQHGLNQSSAG